MIYDIISSHPSWAITITTELLPSGRGWGAGVCRRYSEDTRVFCVEPLVVRRLCAVIALNERNKVMGSEERRVGQQLSAFHQLFK